MNADALRTVTPEEVKVGMRIRRVWKGPRVAYVERLSYGAPDTKVTRYTTDEQEFEFTVARISGSWAFDSEDAGIPLRGDYTIEVLAEAPPAYETVEVAAKDIRAGDKVDLAGCLATAKRGATFQRNLYAKGWSVWFEYPYDPAQATSTCFTFVFPYNHRVTVQRCVSS